MAPFRLRFADTGTPGVKVHEPLWHATEGENAVSGSPSLTPEDTEERNDDDIHCQIYCLAVARHL